MLSYLNPLPALPEYTGPHSVGSAEYEIPLSGLGLRPLPKEISSSTIRFRMFYPAAPERGDNKGVPWVPDPQTTYLGGYLKMARLSPWLSRVLLSIPLFLRTTHMPVYQNAPFANQSTSMPVLVFSHGLVGSLNTHSAILGELASHGICCVTLEHRDGSGVLSLVRNGETEASGDAPTEMSSVYFRQISLRIRPGVLEQRDEQLRIRIFELAALYRALELLNEGKPLKNLAANATSTLRIPASSLNLDPGSVIWSGHSFGGTTIIQFLKSIYYNNQHQGENEPQELLLQIPSPSLVAQITPTSPVALLDPWFMPLKSPNTQRLFRKPLPCHDAVVNAPAKTPRTVMILSTEFAYHWPECHSHMEAITSSNPAENVKVQTQEEYDAEFKLYKSPRDYINKSKKAFAAASTKQESKEKALLNNEPKTAEHNPVGSFMLKDTTHITHSDFGLLFQWFTWYFTGQKEPITAVNNIARCILEAAGLPVEAQPSDAARAQLQRLS